MQASWRLKYSSGCRNGASAVDRGMRCYVMVQMTGSLAVPILISATHVAGILDSRRLPPET